MFTRIAAIAALSAALAVTVYLSPSLAATAGVDVWNLPDLQEQLDDATEQGRELDSSDEMYRRRIEVKEALMADLIAGRVTLAEATDRFLTLSALHPEQLDAIRAAFPGSSDREKVARNVVQYANSRIPAGPQKAAVVARFEAEFDQLVSSLHGGSAN